mmetsp:Transcript_17219/g.19930  ORF Transcript_17219/g.19930 Transcript_17219/m.19930 type:complete len:681 (-) Transcript_17219:49-2091(-)
MPFGNVPLPTDDEFKPIKRQDSGPFLQKPLHATLAEFDQSHHTLYHDANSRVNSVNQSNVDGSSSSQLASAVSSYHSTGSVSGSSPKDDDNIMPNSTTGGNNLAQHQITRHLTLFDLVSIGVGGTIGSGIFVLCGYIAHSFAGPATCISWIISGIAACLSGVCYAELACRMPAAGSSYVYVYASMGELPAVLVAACLSLEYVVSGSAVARSWGDKIIEWLNMSIDIDFDLSSHFSWNFNPMATLVSAASVALLMSGVKESKSVTNFFTVTKVIVVGLMAIGGLILMLPRQNLVPFIPPQYGVAGIFRGATSSFFGYIGFDEVCCVAGEALDPQRNMPLAIVISLTTVTGLYVVAALALTGMQPYYEVSEVSGFPYAFASRGHNIAAQISAFGEVFTLPIVVLISVMAQPRLQYALAKDGLLPEIFARVDENGNLWHSTVICGIFMVIVASFVPFEHLNDMISAGILVAFCMTCSSLIIMRRESPDHEPGKVERTLLHFNFASLVFGISLTHFGTSVGGKVIVAICVFALLICILRLYQCPAAVLFGGKIRASQYKGSVDMRVDSYFKTPCLPLIPCLGIFINWYLVSQLELIGIFFLLLYLALAGIFYFSYGMRHSVGANGGWDIYDYDVTENAANNEEYEKILSTSWTLPPTPLFTQSSQRSTSGSSFPIRVRIVPPLA